MAKKKSALDKFLSKQERKAKRRVRKAVTGSSDSIKTQAKKKARKALTGSSLKPSTQLKRSVKRSTGCIVPLATLGFLLLAIASLVQ